MVLQRVYRFFLIFFSLYIVTRITSCRENKEESYIETYYSSGSIKAKMRLWKDSILIDTAFYYFPNGKLSKIEVRDDSGILNGASYIFYDNGTLFQKISYSNDLKNGFVYEYDENKNLESKILYLNDIQSGDAFWYYTNKNVRKYNFFDFNCRNLNVLAYDSVTSLKITDKYQTMFVSSLLPSQPKSEDSLSIEVLVSNPPKCRTEVIIRTLTKNGKIKSDLKISNVPYTHVKVKWCESIENVQLIGNQYDSSSNVSHKQIEDNPTVGVSVRCESSKKRN